MNTASAIRLSDRLVGALWIVSGGLLSSGILFMSIVFFLHGVDAEGAGMFCLALLHGLFWFCCAAIGFFLLLGKRWPRSGLLAIAAGLVVAGSLNFLIHSGWPPGFSWPVFVLRWLSMLLPIPGELVWALGGLGLLTLVALLWPRAGNEQCAA